MMAARKEMDMHGEHAGPLHFLQCPSYRSLASVAAVLERFVARTPNGCHARQMMHDTELSRREIRTICSALCKLNVVSFSDDDTWVLCGHPGEITLQQAWEAALLVDMLKRRDRTQEDDRTGDREINLLIQQAALAINQNITAELKRFQLDRVRASRWGFLIVS
jgi:hypothetical protein